MEHEQFDAFTRSLTSRHSRQSVLRSLAVVAAGLAGTLGIETGEAKGRRTARRGKKKCARPLGKCGSGKRCCKGPCRNGRCPCTKDRQCSSGKFCQAGTCHKKLALYEPCERDHQCGEGVCDQYNGMCVRNRWACDPDKPGHCRDGTCCPDEAPNGEPGEFKGGCIYRNAENDPIVVANVGCGTCGAPVYCRNPSRCQDGACCCPPGVTCTNGEPPCP